MCDSEACVCLSTEGQAKGPQPGKKNMGRVVPCFKKSIEGSRGWAHVLCIYSLGLLMFVLMSNIVLKSAKLVGGRARESLRVASTEIKHQ